MPVIPSGADYLGTPVGNCAYSDITVFSFHPRQNHHNRRGWHGNDQRRRLGRADGAACAAHGITRDPDLMTHEADGPWYYQQLELGWNYRMTEMQAALGLSQMDQLDAFIARPPCAGRSL